MGNSELTPYESYLQRKGQSKKGFGMPVARGRSGVARLRVYVDAWNPNPEALERMAAFIRFVQSKGFIVSGEVSDGDTLTVYVESSNHMIQLLLEEAAEEGFPLDAPDDWV